jgi:predicted PurR-regulated permease PerM
MTTTPPPEGLRRGSAVNKAILVVALVFLLQAARAVLLPIAIAVVLTFVLATPVRALRRLGVPEFIAAGVLVGSLLGGTMLLASTLAGPAALWWERAPATVAKVLAKVEQIQRAIPLLRSAAQPAPFMQPPAPSPDPIKDKIASEGIALTGTVLGETVSIGVSASATVILLYFLLASEHWMLSRTVEAIPRRRTRALVLSGVRRAQREIGHFLFALSIINVGLGVVTALAMALLGLSNPLLWGALAALLNFIPYIGPLLMTAILLLAGALAFDVTLMMLAPAGAFLLAHGIEANLVSPWFIGRRLSLSPLSVFLVVMLLGWLWGIAGAMIAVPILIGVRIVCKRHRRLRLLAVYLDGDQKIVPSLRSLVRVPRPAAQAAPTQAGGAKSLG